MVVPIAPSIGALDVGWTTEAVVDADQMSSRARASVPTSNASATLSQYTTDTVANSTNQKDESARANQNQGREGNPSENSLAAEIQSPEVTAESSENSLAQDQNHLAQDQNQPGAPDKALAQDQNQAGAPDKALAQDQNQ